MMATVLGTAGEVYFTAGSGTQLLECAFLNVCGFRSRVVVAHNAYFGARLPEMGRRAGVDVVEVTAPWNEPLPRDRRQPWEQPVWLSHPGRTEVASALALSLRFLDLVCFFPVSERILAAPVAALWSPAR